MNYQNQNNDQKEIKVNNLADISQVLERKIELCLMYAIISNPSECIPLVIEKNIEFENHRGLINYWKKVKQLLPELVKLGNDEIVARLFREIEYPLFFECLSSYNALGYEDPDNIGIRDKKPTKTLIDDLFAAKAVRKGMSYIEKRGLINKVFRGCNL